MSTGNSSRREGTGPFGYTFDVPNPTNPPSYQPPGAPLLDNNESTLLENFFENPNNVDPTFLSNNYQGDDSGVYNTTNTLNWMSHDMTNMAHATGAMPLPSRSASQPNPQRPRPGNFPPRMEHHNSISATDDVYAAARLLHSNQSGRYNDMTTQYNGFAGPLSTGAHGLSQSNGYGYPPVPSPTTGPYNFNTASAANGLYTLSGLQGQYGSGDNTGEQIHSLPGRVRAVNARGVPIRFGSDDNFRNSYTGPISEEGEKEEGDNFARLYRVAQEQQPTRDAQGPQSGTTTRKRSRRISEGEVADSDDERSSDEDEYRSKKRRKSKLKNEDEEEFDNVSSGGKNGRRRQSLGQSTSRGQRPTAASPSKKQKSSPGLSKPQRENLTEEQKRNNHIQSEQKRRNLIKQGFEDLNKMVPELRSGGFSKSNMLVEAAKFMKRLREENDELKTQMRALDNG